MRKLLVTLLTAMMILTFSVPATFAAEDEKGTITINGISTDNTYEIYQLLDLESYNKTSGAYSYKVNSNWTGFFDTAEAKEYIAIDSDGYVTWKAAEDDDTKAAFAKKALAYAKANNINPVRSSKNKEDFVITTNSETGKSKGVFSDLALGYYLIDSTMGALCGLTTTNPDASINAKNAGPTIDKQVLEDSTNQWGDTNTADMGQTVEFRVTINVHAGAENYVLHDKMSEGLTFKEVSKIEHVIPGNETHTMAIDKYEVVTGETLDDDCTFEVRFTKDVCDSFETNDKVIVYYEAMLNRNAIVAGNGNPNETWLDYGENHHTTPDITTTYTFAFDVIKTDSQNTLLDGAQFKIYDAPTGGNEVAVVLMDDGVTYRHARADEQEDNKAVSIVVKNGKVRVVGFDNGTYYLEETVAPAGYNKLTARQKFIISDANLDSIFNGDIYSTGSGVHVVNKTGSMLPETGGFGTTLFIIVGGLAVLAAGITLFARRRVSQYEE